MKSPLIDALRQAGNDESADPTASDSPVHKTADASQSTPESAIEPSRDLQLLDTQTVLPIDEPGMGNQQIGPTLDLDNLDFVGGDGEDARFCEGLTYADAVTSLASNSVSDDGPGDGAARQSIVDQTMRLELPVASVSSGQTRWRRAGAWSPAIAILFLALGAGIKAATDRIEGTAVVVGADSLNGPQGEQSRTDVTAGANPFVLIRSDRSTDGDQK